MKPILLIPAMLLATQIVAQPALPGDNTAPVKLSDAIAQYKERGTTHADKERVKHQEKPGEDGDYHLGRWLWYWQQHTDNNGFLVSPTQTHAAWKNYQTVADRSQLKTTATAANWKFQGPTISQSGYGGIGRINAMAFHPNNSNIYWVGSAGGGLWKTVNNGATWTSLTDNLPVLSVSDIDVNPLNPNVLYLCTGDRDGRDHYSVGVLKSVNGGITWDTTGIKWPSSQMRLTNCLVINPADTNSLTLAASDGIYKSYDGGKKWTQTRTGHFKQVLYHPTDTNIIYATSYMTGAADAQIFRSVNGGKTWQQQTFFSGTARATLAVCPASPNTVKAVVSERSTYGMQGFYTSSNSGSSFTMIHDGYSCTQNILSGVVPDNVSPYTDCKGQGWYDLSIAIDPTDVSKVYVGGVNTWYSYTGGSSWDIITQWANFGINAAEVHADKHHLAFHPLVPGRLFECNDGGIYYTDNPLSISWMDISHGLAVTQFYRNAVADEATYILGGTQDNGTKGYDGWQNWTDVTGGDGMDCHIDPVDTNIFYTAIQYGGLYLVDAQSGFADKISDNIPGDPDGGWITPYLVNPHNHLQLVAGYELIYFTPDQGNTWLPITNNALEPGKNMLRLAMTPAGRRTIYAVTENSNSVYVTHNFSGASTATFSKIQSPYPGNISDIKVDAKDSAHFWITYSGYGSPQVAEYKRGTWSRMQSGLPDVPVLCFEADSSNDILYIGTDVGVFYKDTTSAQWQLYNKNMPIVHVTDLGINYRTKEIWAATYGRGMWKSAKQEYEKPKEDDTHIIPFAPDYVTLSPNPGNGHFTVTANSTFANRKVSIRLVDHTGRTVWQNNQSFNGGSELNVSADGLPAGNYIFEIADAKSILARSKVIIAQ